MASVPNGAGLGAPVRAPWQASGPHWSVLAGIVWGPWGISHLAWPAEQSRIPDNAGRDCPQHRYEPAYDSRAREVSDVGLQS